MSLITNSAVSRVSNEVTTFIKDLHKMVAIQFHKYIDLDQTRTEQGTWMTKTLVSMWFKNETNMATMIEMLEIVKENSRRFYTSSVAT